MNVFLFLTTINAYICVLKAFNDSHVSMVFLFHRQHVLRRSKLIFHLLIV
jgi:hypothetical protein